MSESPQSKGGRVTARKLRRQALDRYYANPSVCKFCGSVIEVKEGQKVAEARRKKFCNHSCAARYNNRGVNRHGGRQRVIRKRTGKCERCDCEIRYRDRGAGYVRRKYCDVCVPLVAVESRGQSLVESSEKEELRKRSSNWTSYRASISNHARKIYAQSDRPSMCAICGYDRHVDICHKRPVSEFPDSATIAEVNDIDNLVALCKNHHWELDHGFLERKDL